MSTVHLRTELRRYALTLVVVLTLVGVPLTILAKSDGPQGDAVQGDSALAMVATGAVAASVTEVPLSGPNVSEIPAPLGRVVSSSSRFRTLVSAPQATSGYSTVGVTWAENPQERPGDVQVFARTETAGVWSEWVNFEYDARHAPDSAGLSDEGVRAGTDPFPVGEVDAVQAKIVIRAGAEPDSLRLAVVDPGLPSTSVMAAPAIAPDGDITMSAQEQSLAATEPAIFSRAQWGADERMRDRDSLRYGKITVGFVHHTVNANDYGRDDVPALLRGIYAYHTKSRGWSDIGYNFLVDRFGRIWEGRFGGVDRPVVGAHTLGYNEDSFAMSALGNFETAKPTAALLDAYARLFAWKLSLAGIDPTSQQRVDGKDFAAISGHSDADSTACPGRYLYDKLPAIRQQAATIQPSPSAVERVPNLVGAAWPEVILRDSAAQGASILETGGQLNFVWQRQLAKNWAGKDLIVATGDVTGDGLPDILARAAKTGRAALFPGAATGALGSGIAQADVFSGVDQLTGVGDLSGDGLNDVVGRERASGRLYLYPGTGAGSFRRRVLLGSNWKRFDTTVGVGDLNADGTPDLVTRAKNSLFLVPGARRAIGAPRTLPGAWAQFDLLAGTGDVTGDGRPDLLARSRASRASYVFPGNGDGLAPGALGPFAQFARINFVSMAGSLDGNAATDVVARTRWGNLVLFANNSGRNVVSLAASNVSLANVTHAINVGDWNGDGFGDIVIRQAGTGSLFLRRGTGSRTFKPPVQMRSATKGLRGFVPVGDLSGDGDPDLLVTTAKTGRVHLLPGNGVSGFKSAMALGSAAPGSDFFGVGFWDDDEFPDVVERTAEDRLLLHRGLGFGTRWAPGTFLGTSQGFSRLRSLGDANGDGEPDLVAQRQGDTSLWLLPGARERFGAPRLLTEIPDTYRLVG